MSQTPTTGSRAAVFSAAHNPYICYGGIERTSKIQNIMSVNVGEEVTNQKWNIEITPAVATINKDRRGLNIFLVGCRDEERPSIDGSGRSRTSVPYFVAHARDPKASKPRYLRLSDLEKKSEVRVSIEAAPLKSV